MRCLTLTFNGRCKAFFAYGNLGNTDMDDKADDIKAGKNCIYSFNLVNILIRYFYNLKNKSGREGTDE